MLLEVQTRVQQIPVHGGLVMIASTSPKSFRQRVDAPPDVREIYRPKPKVIERIHQVTRTGTGLGERIDPVAPEIGQQRCQSPGIDSLVVVMRTTREVGSFAHLRNPFSNPFFSEAEVAPVSLSLVTLNSSLAFCCVFPRLNELYQDAARQFSSLLEAIRRYSTSHETLYVLMSFPPWSVLPAVPAPTPACRAWRRGGCRACARPWCRPA